MQDPCLRRDAALLAMLRRHPPRRPRLQVRPNPAASKNGSEVLDRAERHRLIPHLRRVLSHHAQDERFMDITLEYSLADRNAAPVDWPPPTVCSAQLGGDGGERNEEPKGKCELPKDWVEVRVTRLAFLHHLLTPFEPLCHGRWDWPSMSRAWGSGHRTCLSFYRLGCCSPSPGVPRVRHGHAIRRPVASTPVNP